MRRGPTVAFVAATLHGLPLQRPRSQVKSTCERSSQGATNRTTTLRQPSYLKGAQLSHLRKKKKNMKNEATDHKQALDA